jgi:hypothetical protein
MSPEVAFRGESARLQRVSRVLPSAVILMPDQEGPDTYSLKGIYILFAVDSVHCTRDTHIICITCLESVE